MHSIAHIIILGPGDYHILSLTGIQFHPRKATFHPKRSRFRDSATLVLTPGDGTTQQIRSIKNKNGFFKN